MGRDYFSLGSAPYAEECVSVNPDEDYLPAMRAECNRFIGVMRKIMGDEPPGAKLAIMSHSHDFGTYLDVVCYFDDQNELALDYAARCERDVPEFWPPAVPESWPDQVLGGNPGYWAAMLPGEKFCREFCAESACQATVEVEEEND